MDEKLSIHIADVVKLVDRGVRRAAKSKSRGRTKNAGVRPRRNGIGSASAIRRNKPNVKLRPMTVTTIMIPTMTTKSLIMTIGGLRHMTGTGIGEQKVFN